MSSLKKAILKPFNLPADLPQRVSVLGTTGAGKSTMLGLLHLTATDNSNRDPSFYYRLREVTLGAREIGSKLRAGHFPEPTHPGSTFEAEMRFQWKGRVGSKAIEIPFVDIAGEELATMIDRFRSSEMDARNFSFQGLQTLHGKVLTSSGFILIVPIIRTKIRGFQLEDEPDNLPLDPDVNLARIIEKVFDYKESVGMGDSLRGMAVMLTKVDRVGVVLQADGIDLRRPADIAKFMSNMFPETNNMLKGIKNVFFRPSWVNLEYDKTAVPIRNPDGSFRIKVDPVTRMPSFPRESYDDLISWVKSTFA